MQLQAPDDSPAVTYDQQLRAELTPLRFLADAYKVLIIGLVGVGKTFLANALGHIAVRRHHSVHTERADELFKRLRATRLDATYEHEMRKLHRADLLIIDDPELHWLEATETNDFYELIVERHRQASTIITSNRETPEILTMMTDQLLAESAMDRLQCAAYELFVEGESVQQTSFWRCAEPNFDPNWAMCIGVRGCARKPVTGGKHTDAPRYTPQS